MSSGSLQGVHGVVACNQADVNACEMSRAHIDHPEWVRAAYLIPQLHFNFAEALIRGSRLLEYLSSFWNAGMCYALDHLNTDKPKQERSYDSSAYICQAPAQDRTSVWREYANTLDPNYVRSEERIKQPGQMYRFVHRTCVEHRTERDAFASGKI